MFSMLHNVRQTQNLILDQVYEMNMNNMNRNRRPRTTTIPTTNSTNLQTPFSFIPSMPTPIPTQSTTPLFNNTNSNSNDQNREANIEISFIDPRNPDHGMLSNIFSNLLNSQTESNTLSFNDIISNTEIDLNISDTNDMCSICRLNIESNNITRKIKKCNHTFHHTCLDTWLKNHTTCPNCRQDIRITETETQSNPDNTNL